MRTNAVECIYSPRLLITVTTARLNYVLSECLNALNTIRLNNNRCVEQLYLTEFISKVSWKLNSSSPGHLPGVESDSRVRPSRVRAGATPEPTLP